MHRSLKATFFLIFIRVFVLAQCPWQEITDPGILKVASKFQSPPPGYGMILWWGWDGPITGTVIKRDLDKIKTMGFQGVMIEGVRAFTPNY